ncbi:three-helix bundle dimerization domain-containing protein [Nocardia sp. NPDC050718]|uniref:three-helix bundle dimerization domain-containing protein n=1 Tax=Nocardia sp. NPDC050718 TaxID=3155788 RepID=UPI003401B546
MTTHEDQQLDEVIERLTIKYPTVAPAEIADIVRQTYRHFAEANVRDFVPLLVEHHVQDELGTRTGRIPPIPM